MAHVLSMDHATVRGDQALLRLHFTAEDLARLQVATEVAPLWETVLGLQQLGGRRGAPAFRARPAMWSNSNNWPASSGDWGP